MSKPAAAEGAEAQRKKIQESVSIPGGEPIPVRLVSVSNIVSKTGRTTPTEKYTKGQL